jgi:hypothetical protein
MKIILAILMLAQAQPNVIPATGDPPQCPPGYHIGMANHPTRVVCIKIDQSQNKNAPG